MKSKLPLGALVVGIIFCLPRWEFAAELKPATEIISAVKSASGEKEERNDTAARKFSAEVERFAADSKIIPPADAARRWLELLEELWKLPGERYPGLRPISSADLIAALPGPGAWPELARLIEARPEKEGAERVRETALRLIAATLQNDRAAQQMHADAIKALYRESPQQLRFAMHAIQNLNEAIVQLSEDPKQLQAMVEARIANAGQGQLNLPNLVALFGEATATNLLQKALLTTFSSFSVQGESTRKLAREIALASVDQLKSPPWGLISNLEAVPLYEALNKRFPAAEKKSADTDIDLPFPSGGFDNYERGQAHRVYILGLIIQGRTDEAMAELDKHGDEGHSFLMVLDEIKTHSEEISNFLNQILRKKPELPMWPEYVQVASRAGHSEAMLKLLQETLASDKLSDENKAVVRNHLYRAYLAADKIDEALAEMRRLATELQNSEAGAESLADLAASFADVGAALEKPDLVREGAEMLTKSSLAEQPKKDSGWFTASVKWHCNWRRRSS